MIGYFPSRARHSIRYLFGGQKVSYIAKQKPENAFQHGRVGHLFPCHNIVQDDRMIQAVQIGMDIPSGGQRNRIGKGTVIYIVSIELFLTYSFVKGACIFFERQRQHFQFHIPP